MAMGGKGLMIKGVDGGDDVITGNGQLQRVQVGGEDIVDTALPAAGQRLGGRQDEKAGNLESVKGEKFSAEVFIKPKGASDIDAPFQVYSTQQNVTTCR